MPWGLQPLAGVQNLFQETPVRVNCDFLRVAPAVGACLLACGEPVDDPSLVNRRDSAGVEIVEASRPLWGDGDSEAWRVDPEPVVDLALTGDGSIHEFHRVQGMTRLSSGGLVVADGGSDEIRLFSEGGDFLDAAGGPGEGPGEFTGLRGLARGHGDTLLALDQDDRMALFAPDLTFVGESGLPPFSQAIYALDDGTLIVESETMSALEILESGGLVRVPTVLWSFDLEDASIDSIGEAAGEEQHVVVSGPRQGQTGTLFGRRSHVATHGGNIYRGRAITMELEELTAAGDLVRILRIPDFPLALSAEAIRVERGAMLGDDPPSWFRQVIERVPAPATRPAYGGLFVDPSGALWLRPFRGRSEQAGPETWQVLANDGTWLGRVEFPANFQVMETGMDAVLGVWRDELDVEHPWVLRLQRDQESPD